jgi:hypothetical protein
MGLALILIGILIWALVSPTIGIILIIVGVILFLVPGVPYGYSTWRGRRGPPA